MQKMMTYIIDDEAELTKSLSWLLESLGYTVQCFANAQDFLKLDYINRPACLLLDIRMPGISGLELQEILIAKNITLPIIFLTGHGDVAMAVRAMKLGASNFHTKPVNSQILLESINKAIATDQQQHIIEQQKKAVLERASTLTSREREVFMLLIAGQPSKKVAQDLNISLNTVELHRSKIMKKMAAKTAVQLVNLAWMGKLLDVAVIA